MIGLRGALMMLAASAHWRCPVSSCQHNPDRPVERRDDG
jgi:hypothetical protein